MASFYRLAMLALESCGNLDKLFGAKGTICHLWLSTVLGTVRASIEDALVFLIDDGGGVSYYTAHQFAKVIVGVCCKIRRRRM